MRRKPVRQSAAFTLIELLIVVAIIAILAAIAVPNFLEAQTRSKVARVKSDHRTASLALESYALDGNGYYPPGRAVALPYQLSTPVAYLTASQMDDPFLAGKRQFYFQGAQVYVNDWRYQYASYPNAQNLKSGKCWLIASVGPSAVRWGLWSYVDQAVTGDPKMLQNLQYTFYDPSNGTNSIGYIMRGGGDAHSQLLSVINK